MTDADSPVPANPLPVDLKVDEVVVLDFGGQYSQLIARRVRECGVFSELLPHHVGADEVARRKPKGIILSGGPASVYSPDAPPLDPQLLEPLKFLAESPPRRKAEPEQVVAADRELRHR